MGAVKTKTAAGKEAAFQERRRRAMRAVLGLRKIIGPALAKYRDPGAQIIRWRRGGK